MVLLFYELTDFCFSRKMMLYYNRKSERRKPDAAKFDETDPHLFDSHVHGILEGWYSILEKTRENVTILALRDNLAIGPLKPENPALRKAALQETGTEEVADSFCDDYRAFLQALTTLPPDRPCCVWASDSPHERTGVALAGAYLASTKRHVFPLRQRSPGPAL